MKKIKTILISFFLLILVLQGCYNDKEELVYPDSVNCDTTTHISYSLTIVPIIENHCLGCHGNNEHNSLGGNLNLEGHSNIIIPVNNGSLLKSIEHQPGASPMPKNSPKLPNCKIETIKKWIDAGAANN
jgi:hypothetical protein